MKDTQGNVGDDTATVGVLYVVATPIGHLADLTERARQILCATPTILAEDTRVTAVLLRSIGARPESLLSSDQFRESARIDTVLTRLRSGANVALVSDAGTPGISDPGAPIVAAVRSAGMTVVPIPGCSALAALASVSGLADGRFVFEGFLPGSTSGRNKRLAELHKMCLSVIFYEAPHRIDDFAKSILQVWGATTHLVVGREVTKAHEEIWSGSADLFESWLSANPFRAKGEYVVMATAAKVDTPMDEVVAQANAWLEELVPLVGTNSAAKIAAKVGNISRTVAYELALTINNKNKTG